MQKFRVYENFGNVFYCDGCGEEILTDHYYMNDKCYCLACFCNEIMHKYFTNNIVNCRDFLAYCHPEYEENFYEMTELELIRKIQHESVYRMIEWLNE